MLNFSARLTEHCTRSKSAQPGDQELSFSCPKLNVSRLRRLGAVRAHPWDILGFFDNQNTRNSLSCFATGSEKKPFKFKCLMAPTVQYLGIMRTVLLHCPISAEIRTVNSQSDLRILLRIWIILLFKYGKETGVPRIKPWGNSNKVLDSHSKLPCTCWII